MMRKVMKEKKGMKKKPIAKNLDQGEDNILALTLYLRYKIEGGDEKKPPLMSKLVSEEKREVRKEYRAIVWGIMQQDKLKISLPLKKTDIPFKMKVGFFKAKEAFTEIEVIKRGKNFSFLSVKPISGRTHQIRVHLSFLGYPIVGDKKYGRKDNYDKLFLHAYRLGFYHPSEGNFVEFEAPLPEHFLKFLKENV